MVMKENKMVHPIKKKGLLYLNQTDDSLIHLCWKDRTTGVVEDDLIIFPDDAEFRRVNSCTTGRVYVLKFKSSSRRNFYWLQEPSEEKDSEYCSKINEYINHPPPPGSRSSNASGASGSGSGGLSSMGLADLGSLPDSELQNLLNNMNPQQLMQMLGGVGGSNLGAILSGASGGSTSPSASARTSGRSSSSTTSAAAAVATPATSTTTTGSTGGSVPKSSSQVSGGTSGGAAKGASGSATDPIQLSTLQSIISGLTVPPSATGGSAGTSGTSGSDVPIVDLSGSINQEVLRPLLSNKDFMGKVREHLPKTGSSVGSSEVPSDADVSAELTGTVSSPQFQQALSIFSAALASGQLGPLMAQFNLSSECVEAANRGDMIAFIKALETSEKSKREASGSSDMISHDKKPDDKKNDGDDDEMALD